jgi:hypothetical protein
MHVRAIALAIPLALGMACQHANKTGAMGRPSGEGQQASSGGEAGAPLAQDPLMRPGPSIQGHSDDRTVAGHIATVTADAVAIETDQGETKTLQIVPETAIQLDGQDASSDALAEGQPVRASFDTVDGQEIAVKIRAGEAAASGDAPIGGTGTSVDQAPAAPTAPDAGWGPAPDTGSGGPKSEDDVPSGR